MDLAALQQQLQQTNLPPVESWNPPFCGDLPLHIASNGDWYYQQSKIERLGLVKLFASVLLQQNGEYFLQTPAEKVRISVEDSPFVVTQYQWQATPLGPALCLTTNLQHQLLVSPQYPILLHSDPHQQLLPYLHLWRGLCAKLHRNVYYKLAEQCHAVYCNGAVHYQLKSAGFTFSMAITNEEFGR